MVEVTLFHFRDRNTVLNRAHPLTKILCILGLSTMLSGASLPRTAALLCLLTLIAMHNRLPIGRFRREMRFFLVMGTVMGLARALHATSWVEPATVVMRFASIVLMGLLFADTTAPDDLSRAIGYALSPFLKEKGYRIGSTLELTLSTVPLLFDVSLQISWARKARGESAWHHPVRRIVSYGETVFNLLLQRAEDLEAALQARYYNPDAKRDTVPFGLPDLLLPGFTAIGLGVLWILT